MNMRRKTLKGLAASAVGAAGAISVAGLAGVSAPAIAKETRTLKLVSAYPKNFPGLGTAPENIAKRIEIMSDGALKLKIFAAGELVSAFEVFDATATGTADMYFGAEYYWQGKSPAFSFFTAVPFGMTANEQTAWVNFGGGQELWDALSAKFNIRAFLAANSSTQMGGWFNREINSVADFKGLKMRMPGLGGEVIRKLGAIAVALPGGEIFPSMKSGAIDATEWVGPWNDVAFGFHQVAKYYYCPGFQEPCAALSLGINLDVWESLTPAQQMIIRVACQAENDRTLAQFNHESARALELIRTQYKDVEIREFPDDVVHALREKSREVVEEIARSDAFTAKVYKSYKKSLEGSLAWGAIGEEAYLRWRRNA